MKKKDSYSTHWDLMRETAQEVAALKDGSHDRLKAEFLEEFGRLPTSELLDYYDDLLKSDIEKTRLSPAKTSEKDKHSVPDLQEANSEPEEIFEEPLESNEELLVSVPDPEEQAEANGSVFTEMAFAEKIASQKQETILSFRQLFETTYGKEPSLEVVAHFLKQLAYSKREASNPPRDQDESAHTRFITELVNTGSPTVLSFRRKFEKQFGAPPSNEVVTSFLNKLSRKKSKR